MPGPIDYDRTLQVIMQRAALGLQNTAEYCLGRAKQHAPVRAIFQRDRRGKEFSKSFKTIRTHKRYMAFMRSRSQNRRMNLPQQSVLGDNIRGEQSGGITRGGKRFGAHGSTRGHANSLYPVFRGKDRWGKSKMTGDFRNAAALSASFSRRRGAGAGGYEEALKSRPQWKRARTVEGNTPGGKSRIYQQSGVHARLTSRGRYEVRRAARQNVVFGPHRTGSASALFKGRIGGRLRGEIEMTPQTKKGTAIWQYIVAPTSYAVHQEFGTTRHRAQPFLRPALYESRNVLRSEVRRMVSTSNIREQSRGAASLLQPYSGGERTVMGEGNVLDFTPRGEQGLTSDEARTGSGDAPTLGEAAPSGGH